MEFLFLAEAAHNWLTTWNWYVWGWAETFDIMYKWLLDARYS